MRKTTLYFISAVFFFSGLSVAAQRPSPQPPADQNARQIDQAAPASHDIAARVEALEERYQQAAGFRDTDYILRIQKQYENYYEKAFDTQVLFISLLGAILTVVLWLASRFGYRLFDAQIETKLKATSSELRSDFERTLRAELTALEAKNSELVGQAIADLRTRSAFEFQFSQGLTFLASDSYQAASGHFARALRAYRKGRERRLFPPRRGAKAAADFFMCLQRLDPAKFAEVAAKELAGALFDGMEIELALAALDVAELGPLVRDRARRKQDAE